MQTSTLKSRHAQVLPPPKVPLSLVDPGVDMTPRRKLKLTHQGQHRTRATSDVYDFLVAIRCSTLLTIDGCVRHAVNERQLTYLHTHTHPFNGQLSRTTRVSRYQKGKPIWGPDLQNILRQSYDYQTIIPKLRSTYDGRLISTRSSAIAEGPRDASCQLKSCQLPRNSAETTYTTSPDQIYGMKLEI